MTHRTAARHRPDRHDAGFSLLEVMVGASMMLTVMAVATSGLITMYQTAGRAESAALTQTSLTESFYRLDRELRYAYRVHDPYLTDDDFAVDYVIPDRDNNLLCVRLTMPRTGGTLMRRQWPQPGTATDPAATISAVATHLSSAAMSTDVPPSARNPFTRIPPGMESNFDRLNLHVRSTLGQSGKGTTRTYDLTFTALNTVALTTPLTCRTA